MVEVMANPQHSVVALNVVLEGFFNARGRECLRKYLARKIAHLAVVRGGIHGENYRSGPVK